MSERTVLHSPDREEEVRQDWYLLNRDRFVARLVRREANRLPLPSKPTVLDAGCGIGGLTAILRDEGVDVTGVGADEPSPQKGAASGRPDKDVKGDLCTLPFSDRSFALCVSSEVLEHLDDDTKGLQELVRVCRGTLVLTVPAHGRLWTRSDDILMHRRRYSRQEFAQLLSRAGISGAAIRGYGIVPGLAILGYRLISGDKGRSKDAPPKKEEPLAARFRPPRWVDALLSLLFRIDLRLSQWGLVPWGQGWWVAVKTRTGEDPPRRILEH
jgi:SAM-dependent methyltransferase